MLATDLYTLAERGGVAALVAMLLIFARMFEKGRIVPRDVNDDLKAREDREQRLLKLVEAHADDRRRLEEIADTAIATNQRLWDLLMRDRETDR